MRNLESLIAQWRKTMLAKVGQETLDELESHLRETVDQLVRSGVSEPEAFHSAITQLGGEATIASEFKKVGETTWLPVKLIIGFGVVLALALAIFPLVQLHAGRFNLLLACHVFSVGLGYTSTFLVGALGFCFVGQRCFSDLSPSRMHSLVHLTFKGSCIALSLTVLGVILAMIWAKTEWGRYWAWDAKETGAFAIILWQMFFLISFRIARCTPRGILNMSLLGNIVVSLGWVGGNMLSSQRGEWAPHYSLGPSLLLVAGVFLNLAFFFIGLGPAGWLRLHRVS